VANSEFTDDFLPVPDGNESDFGETKTKAMEFSTANMTLGMTAEDPQLVDDAIGRILSSYDLGQKLRRLRLRRKVALVDLGKHTGLSASMLSQLENGKLVPTLPTLTRIAMVFDVSLEYFFSERKQQKLFAVVRARQRMRFPDRPDKKLPAYFFECLAFSVQDKAMQAYLAEFTARSPEAADEHFHEGSEFLYVFDGSLGIIFQGEEHVLRTGDSVYFDSSEPHAYRGMGKSGARAIVITVPPRL
jgi:transcriptional regulator with XRE-family HTH domain